MLCSPAQPTLHVVIVRGNSICMFRCSARREERNEERDPQQTKQPKKDKCPHTGRGIPTCDRDTPRRLLNNNGRSNNSDIGRYNRFLILDSL